MPEDFVVLLFYRFVPIDDPEGLRDSQRELCAGLGLRGRMLIAHEGINGTFEGTREAVESYKRHMRTDPRFADMPFKESAGTGTAFPGLRIKVRDEVVTLGAGEFDVAKETAPEVTAEELESMYERDDEFVILDLRNDFEIDAGRFERTVHPDLQNFRDLPQKLETIAPLKKKKVITVCTGGIRCEKATCLLRREGFENVYQLKDGIHTYMQKFPGRRFKGTLYVFDNRQVTRVIDTPVKEIVGACYFCGRPSEDFYSDDDVKPSRKVICCSVCITEHAELRSCVNA